MSDFLKAKPIFAEFDIYNGQNKCGFNNHSDKKYCGQKKH